MLHTSLGLVDEESSSAGAYFDVVTDSGAPAHYHRRESESAGGIPVSVISSASSRELRSSVEEEQAALRSLSNGNPGFMMGSTAGANGTGTASAMNAPLFITASPLSTIGPFSQMYLNPHTNQLMIVNTPSIPQSQPLTSGLMLLQASSHNQAAVQTRQSVSAASAIPQMPMPAIVGFPAYTAMHAGSSLIPGTFVVRTPEGYYTAATGFPFHGGVSAQQFIAANGMVAEQNVQPPPLPFASVTSGPGNGTRYTPVLPRPQPGSFEHGVVEKRSVETQMSSKLQQGSNAPQPSTAINSSTVGPVSIEIPQRSTGSQKDPFVSTSTVNSPAVSTKQEGSNVQTSSDKSVFSLIDSIRTSPPSFADAFDPHAQFMHEIQLNGAAKPQILTHVVEGLVIREAAEPFPISAFPFDEFVTDAMYDLSEPPQLEPAIRNAVSIFDNFLT